MFSVWGPLPLVHSSPHPLTVIENTPKRRKQRKLSVLVAANGYVSLSVRWGRTPERCGFQCDGPERAKYVQGDDPVQCNSNGLW